MDKIELIEKLETIKNLIDECLYSITSSDKKAPVIDVTVETKEKPQKDIALLIVNKAQDCDEATAIQKNVLDKFGAEGKILLSFYISSKYFGNEWLSSGNIEKITANLGIKINVKNVSNYLLKYKKYLESGTMRKKGQSTPYRLNRNGTKRFEEIINNKTD